MFHEKVCFNFVTKSKSKLSSKFQEKSKSKFILRIHPKVSEKFPRSFKIDLISEYM